MPLSTSFIFSYTQHLHIPLGVLLHSLRYFFSSFFPLSSKQQMSANYTIAVWTGSIFPCALLCLFSMGLQEESRQPRHQLGTASCGGWATGLHPLRNWFLKRGFINTYSKWYKQLAPTWRGDIMYRSQPEMKRQLFDLIESGLLTQKANIIVKQVVSQ